VSLSSDHRSVRILLTGCTPAITNGLAAAWEFEQNANDSSGNGYDATAFGGISSSNYISGVVGDALYLESGQYLATAATSEVWNQWTISVFAKPADLPAGTFGQTIVEREQLGHFHDMELGIRTGSKVYVEVDLASETHLYSTSPVVANEWQHIAVTYDGAFNRIYIDGSLDATYANSGAQIDVTAPILIGRHINPNGHDYYSGALDQLLIYDRSLSASRCGAPVGVRHNVYTWTASRNAA